MAGIVLLFITAATSLLTLWLLTDFFSQFNAPDKYNNGSSMLSNMLSPSLYMPKLVRYAGATVKQMPIVVLLCALACIRKVRSRNIKLGTATRFFAIPMAITALLTIITAPHVAIRYISNILPLCIIPAAAEMTRLSERKSLAPAMAFAALSALVLVFMPPQYIYHCNGSNIRTLRQHSSLPCVFYTYDMHENRDITWYLQHLQQMETCVVANAAGDSLLTTDYLRCHGGADSLIAFLPRSACPTDTSCNGSLIPTGYRAQKLLFSWVGRDIWLLIGKTKNTCTY